MLTTCIQPLCVALVGVAIVSSCSRPVAYFQRGLVEPASTLSPQIIASDTPTQAISSPAEPLTQAHAAFGQIEAYVRNDSKLVLNRTLNRRMERVKNLPAAIHQTLTPTTVYTPRKANVVERLILKKMNKRISRQLAPAHPEKAMLSRSYLIGGGAVLLIAGLLLLIIGTGTVAFIGLIVSLVGALGLLLGLLG